MTSTDVVIVGAGPTGLMMASVLTRLGVSNVVIDGKPGPTRESRALVLQARTMEIFDQLGIVDRFLAEATVAGGIRPGFGRRAFDRVSLERLGTGVTPYPGLYVLEQSKTERLLGEGQRVLWGEALESLAQDEDGVRVVTSAGRVIRALFCVGADGSSSAVRSAVGIPFEGRTNEHTFYVADAVGVRGLDHASINLRFAGPGFALTFPMGGTDHRVLGVLPGSTVTESAARTVLANTFGVTYEQSRWFSTYRVHHRVAARFRAGRVFLAGDAAHVHSPVGAQGMNTGLQDAHNLACTIADVLADRGTLDRYEAERRPVALRLVSTTDTAFGFVTSDRMPSRALRRWVFPVAMPLVARRLPRVGRAARVFEYLSQTRIHYWMSTVHGRRRDPVVGRRLPWNGDNYDVLRSFTWQVHAYGEVPELRIEVHRFPVVRNPRLKSGMLYLVRPDGFVAAEAPPELAEQLARDRGLGRQVELPARFPRGDRQHRDIRKPRVTG